jgi:hypothetical protein
MRVDDRSASNLRQQSGMISQPVFGIPPPLEEIERRIHGIDFKTHSQCQRNADPDGPDRQCRISVSSFPENVGGASRDRTDDLKLAKLALSQLSYGPT